MGSAEKEKYDYRANLLDINPSKLIEVLPRWKIEEKIFARQFKKGQLLTEERGWVCTPPYKYGVSILIEKDVKRVTVRNGMSSISLEGVRTVCTKQYTELSLIDFVNTNSKLHLWFPHQDRKVEVVLETGRYPNSTNTHLEMTPESRLKVGPQTTLEELVSYF